MCMSTPSYPTPTPPPTPDPPPKATDPAVKAARDAERQRIADMAGRASTIKTGPQGLTDPANTTGKKLLGQ